LIPSFFSAVHQAHDTGGQVDLRGVEKILKKSFKKVCGNGKGLYLCRPVSKEIRGQKKSSSRFLLRIRS
jgi:hypothetical protein